MSSITGYELVSAKTAKELSRLVGERILDGWKLYGYPFACEGGFYQAMTSKKATEKRLRKTTEDG